MKDKPLQTISNSVMEADRYLSSILEPRCRRANKKKRAQKDILDILKRNLPW